MALFSAVVSGLLYALTFPPFNYSFIAWVALIPLLLALTNKRRNNFMLGFLSGLTANLLILAWLGPTFKAANVSTWVMIGCWFLLSAMFACYFGVFTTVYTYFPENAAKPYLAAALWVVLEQIRTHLLTGYPWTLFAHSQAYHPLFIQISAITGALGVSFLLVGINVALLTRNRTAKISIALLFAVVCAYGWYRLETEFTGDQQVMNVAILQGDIDQYRKWDDAYETDIRHQYEILAAFATTIRPDLIVWPETAVPGWYPNEKKYEDWVRGLVKKTKTVNLVGAVTDDQGKPLNSAFLIDAEGNDLGRYDKMHLVPFGEYVPFGKFMGRWIPYLGKLGTFESGPKHLVLRMGDISFATTICYEAIFPALVRATVNQGANVIVNITNDGWFLTTAAPEQHYVANIFRAIENDRPLIRAANTGISAILDARGREIARSKLMDRTVLEGSILIPHESPRTFFSIAGSWFSVACFLSLIGYYFWWKKNAF